MKHFKLIFLILLPSLLAGRIAIYSDTQYNDEVHSQIVQAVVAQKPDLAVICGDLSTSGKEQRDYDNWKQIAAPLLNLCPVYPARGNHDKDLALFLENFPALGGQAYYTVEHDSLRLVILDSNQDLRPGSTQYLWLKDILSRETELPILLFLHHPVFSSGMHGDEKGLQLFLPALLKDTEVKAVFSGHDHDYERSVYQGISYIVNGGAGGKLRPKKNANPYRKVFKSKHHYLIGNKTPDGISFRVFSLEGKCLDRFNLRF